ncbi:hypothetical protein [Radiobacillus sp. PE A8.2]
MLSKHTKASYFYYAGLSEAELEKEIKQFGSQMTNNSAGELVSEYYQS